MDAEPANESPSLRALTRSNILYFTTFIALTVAAGQALFAGPMLPWRDLLRPPRAHLLLDHARTAGSSTPITTKSNGSGAYWLFYGSVWLVARVTTRR